MACKCFQIVLCCDGRYVHRLLNKKINNRLHRYKQFQDCQQTNLQIQAQLGQQMPWSCDTCLLSAYLTRGTY